MEEHAQNKAAITDRILDVLIRAIVFGLLVYFTNFRHHVQPDRIRYTLLAAGVYALLYITLAQPLKRFLKARFRRRKTI